VTPNAKIFIELAATHAAKLHYKKEQTVKLKKFTAKH
jgi:hypothetical protein